MRFAPILFVTLLAACSESTENEAPVKKDTGVDASTSETAVDTGTPIGDTTPTDGGGGAIAFNEISGDDDFIELVNTGSAAVDLSKWGLGGENSDGGLGSVFEFPAGTSLAPKAYLLIRAKVTDAGAGPTADCGDAGVSTCFQVSWGISASRGETLRLVKPDGSTAVTGVLPSTVPTGKSWCRLPDSTGDFKACTPTPGAANAP